MADCPSEVQGNDAAPAMFLRIGAHQFKWSPDMTDPDALAVVPQGVAENLAIRQAAEARGV